MPYRVIDHPACAECRQPFRGPSVRIVCGTTCRNRRTSRQRQNRAVTGLCEHCGQSFTYRKLTHYRGRFCSRDHFRTWNRLRSQDLFWSRIVCDLASGCWLWTGPTTKKGYGDAGHVFNLGPNLAHRITYMLLVGPLARGHALDHLCRTPLCVRPDHLEPVSDEVNTRRMLAAMRRQRAWQQVGQIIRLILYPSLPTDSWVG